MISVSREIAYKALLQWYNHPDDPHQILDEHLPETIKPEDSGFARELFFGTIKFSRQLDYYIAYFHHSKKLNNKLQQILRLAFYQLIHAQNIPEYAVVSEAVELTHKYLAKKQAGFINGVLRNFLRNRKQVALPDINNNLIEHLGVKYSFPDWLVKRYLKRFGNEQTESLLNWCNQPPTLSFFVNRFITDDNHVCKALDEQNIEYSSNSKFPGYYNCSNPSGLIKSDIFIGGMIIIGDPAQSLSPVALQPLPDSTALDLFAAPGGKTAALASMTGKSGSVIASDSSLKRLQLTKTNLDRWHLDNVRLLCSNVFQFASSRNFKYILADVPCSGTGTMRRNPDLRWKLKPADINRHAVNQGKLLKTAAGMLAKSGTLVYSTCSIEPEENTETIDGFLKQNPDYGLKDIDALRKFELTRGLYLVLPHIHNSDGAFVAVIERRSRNFT